MLIVQTVATCAAKKKARKVWDVRSAAAPGLEQMLIAMVLIMGMRRGACRDISYCIMSWRGASQSKTASQHVILLPRTTPRQVVSPSMVSQRCHLRCYYNTSHRIKSHHVMSHDNAPPTSPQTRYQTHSQTHPQTPPKLSPNFFILCFLILPKLSPNSPQTLPKLFLKVSALS